MKLKSLILALPVLCFACNSSISDTSDPASQMDATPLLARHVSGLQTLATDNNYEEPCTILGEEYIRDVFKLEETVALEEGHHHEGCEFSWAGHKVQVAFGGARPYSSIYLADYMFDKMYQSKHETTAAPAVEDVNKMAESGPKTEGTGAEGSPADSTHQTQNDHQPEHSGVSASMNTEHAVSTGHYEAVPEVGDKAVWDAKTGAMHVLYNNNIISVMVESKTKPKFVKNTPRVWSKY